MKRFRCDMSSFPVFPIYARVLLLSMTCSFSNSATLRTGWLSFSRSRGDVLLQKYNVRSINDGPYNNQILPYPWNLTRTVYVKESQLFAWRISWFLWTRIGGAVQLNPGGDMGLPHSR